MKVFDKASVGSLIHAREPERQSHLVDLVAESGAVLDSHFVLASGVHSRYFLRFRSLGSDASRTQRVADEVLRSSASMFNDVTLVAPESAGFFLAEALKRKTGAPMAVVSTDARRRPSFQSRPGKPLTSGDRVVLVNDVATSGGSLRLLRDYVERSGASVVGTVVFAVLGANARELLSAWGLPAVWLIEPRWPTYEPGECPLCQAGKPYVLSLELG